MSLQLLQISDCHLFADPDHELRGVITWPRFVSTVNALREQFPQCDRLIITGDTAHDEEQDTYEAVRYQLRDWADETLLLPGNHDCRDTLRSVFPQCGQGGLEGRVTFSQRLGNWQLIGLDSQITGELVGEIGATQLDWLREQLAASADANAIIFLHHPPIEVGAKRLDSLRLQDPQDLFAVIHEFSHVQLVCCGHVHHAVTANVGGTLVMTTPAVGPQFVPRVDDVVFNDLLPAARLLELSEDGTWRTQVLRFPVEERS